MPISADQFLQLAQAHFGRAWESIHAGYGRHVSDPLRLEYRGPTRSTCVNDLIFGELIANFDGVPSVRPIGPNHNHLRFICVEDRVLLWLKKVDAGRFTSNYPTELALDRLNGQTTMDGFPEATIIACGYLTNADETAICRISFFPPSEGVPEWYFDLVPITNVLQMGQPQQAQQAPLQFRIVRGPENEVMGL